MREYILNYYPLFKCKADKCQNTCCAGWVTCIDNSTLDNYKNNNSPFSNNLKKGIDFKKSIFKRDKNRRCAFLTDNGLCEIICNLGEESLCQICRDHPRFKSGFNGETITGLGFSCEEATNIILSFKDKIQPVLINDDNQPVDLDFCEKTVLEFRTNALKILQDRAIYINDRITTLLSLCNASICASDYKKILKTYLSLERLNKSWTTRLKSIKNTSFSLAVNDNLSLYTEQFLVNGIYRHVSTAEDITEAQSITVACIISWLLIQNIYKTKTVKPDINILFDIVREFSSEVEYSPSNACKLFNFTYKYIN